MGNISARQAAAAREFERQEKEALVKKATAEIQQTAGALRLASDKQVKQFWSRPADQIVHVTYDGLGEGIDEVVDLPVGDGSLDRAKVVEAMKKFTEILNSKGFTLSRDGRTRLMTFVGYQFRANNTDPHSVQSYVNAFDRLYQLECFGDEVGWSAELVKHEPAPAPEAAPEPEDLSKINIDSIPVSGTREAEMRAKKIVSAQFESWIGDIASQWVQSLQADPWNVQLSHEEWLVVVKKLERLFVEQNLPIVPKSFDIARRIFTKDGTLPPGLLLQDEALADRIEMTPNLSGDRNARLEFVAESRKIRGL